MCFQTHQIDDLDIPSHEQDWFHVYGDVQEAKPDDALSPLGAFVQLTPVWMLISIMMR